MKEINPRNQKEIARYSKLVLEAMELGVSIEDIIFETRKYHGHVFANLVAQRIGSGN